MINDDSIIKFAQMTLVFVHHDISPQPIYMHEMPHCKKEKEMFKFKLCKHNFIIVLNPVSFLFVTITLL